LAATSALNLNVVPECPLYAKEGHECRKDLRLKKILHVRWRSLHLPFRRESEDSIRAQRPRISRRPQKIEKDHLDLGHCERLVVSELSLLLLT